MPGEREHSRYRALASASRALSAAARPWTQSQWAFPVVQEAARRLRKDIAMPKVLQPHTAVPAGITGKITKTCFDRENPIPFPGH